MNKKKAKMLLRNERYDELINKATGVYRFYYDLRELESLQIEDLIDKWWEVFKGYLKLWGWNKRSIKDFWYFDDNFKKLHPVDGDELTIQAFCSDLMYCSDRMSPSRLFRFHWQFRYLPFNVSNSSKVSGKETEDRNG